MLPGTALLMAAVGVVSLYRYWWPERRGLIGLVWAGLTCLLVASVHRLWTTVGGPRARWAAVCLGLAMAVVSAVMYAAAAVLAAPP